MKWINVLEQFYNKRVNENETNAFVSTNLKTLFLNQA